MNFLHPFLPVSRPPSLRDLPRELLKKIVLVLWTGLGCYSNPVQGSMWQNPGQDKLPQTLEAVTPIPEIPVSRTVRIATYFQFMDSLTQAWKTKVAYPLSEHLIVNANPWIIDTLANTDYYRKIAQDSFVYDQQNMVVLKQGDTLRLPDQATAKALLDTESSTWIDVNIPEFKLRIYRDSILMHSFPVRVGQNRSRYLQTAGRFVDLRTKTGLGIIVGHNRFPDFYNPVDGKQFYLTRRDDGRTTRMPQIPWMDTSINGIRHGQMIHPTTNPNTLGKAYSNGCIGLGEAASWIVYYHAPIGTRIRIRYTLQVTDAQGTTIVYPDIYKDQYARGDVLPH